MMYPKKIHVLHNRTEGVGAYAYPSSGIVEIHGDFCGDSREVILTKHITNFNLPFRIRNKFVFLFGSQTLHLELSGSTSPLT